MSAGRAHLYIYLRGVREQVLQNESVCCERQATNCSTVGAFDAAIQNGSNQTIQDHYPNKKCCYGYNKKRHFQAIEMGAEAIICDDESTDSGPQKLVLDSSTASRESYEKGIKTTVDAAYHQIQSPNQISRSNGSDEHVNDFVQINSLEKGYKFKIIKIYGGINKDLVHKAF
ncbi:uncharacterized protein Z518_10251 [Rhinocladiella mackenziei CBS 650.93]|uniref:Uncharacterized protein n=1 Tax=Rhinocladiella mackenziei CBS 650.93 TaxID=1442369 RepID=A0A0D2I2X0_9EURO|nr:uncharacterized protein Z518_10251 [Rhinocladiella mackenziei CBS 650.93]KIX00114.1 hypothetical protein Z518_10251 [Rhinocladiella mackenziei CBS 650.93]